jgi:hypothetical protein
VPRVGGRGCIQKVPRGGPAPTKMLIGIEDAHGSIVSIFGWVERLRLMSETSPSMVLLADGITDCSRVRHRS